jgi:hypothetical protein
VLRLRAAAQFGVVVVGVILLVANQYMVEMVVVLARPVLHRVVVAEQIQVQTEAMVRQVASSSHVIKEVKWL